MFLNFAQDLTLFNEQFRKTLQRKTKQQKEPYNSDWQEAFLTGKHFQVNKCALYWRCIKQQLDVSCNFVLYN